MDVKETPVPLPSAPAQSLEGGIFLQPPLSRRGHGPGILIIGAEETLLRGKEHILDPPPLQKWAEEGYAVLAAGLPLQGGSLKTTLERGIQALKELPECDVKDKFGLICGFYWDIYLGLKKIILTGTCSIRHNPPRICGCCGT
jgi:carboxymethylenebutenolidase